MTTHWTVSHGMSGYLPMSDDTTAFLSWGTAREALIADMRDYADTDDDAAFGALSMVPATDYPQNEDGSPDYGDDMPTMLATVGAMLADGAVAPVTDAEWTGYVTDSDDRAIYFALSSHDSSECEDGCELVDEEDAGIRSVTIYRTTYRIFSTEDGLSDRTDGGTETTVYPCEGSRGSFDHDGRTVVWVETPVREAVGILYRENLTYGADGGDWFGYPEPYDHPYDDRCEETTAHLVGEWTDRERIAIARMVSWLESYDHRRAREYASRF